MTFRINSMLRLCLLTAGLSRWAGNAQAYSGTLWLNQANQKFAEPGHMLALGFVVGVVYSWNQRRETRQPEFCFSVPADQMQSRNLLAIVKDYINQEQPNLEAPAAAVVRVALMARFPCREAITPTP